jgi:hypothetical protein
MTKTELQITLAEATQTDKKTAGVFLDRFRPTNHTVDAIGAGPGFDGWLFPGEPRRRR